MKASVSVGAIMALGKKNRDGGGGERGERVKCVDDGNQGKKS